MEGCREAAASCTGLERYAQVILEDSHSCMHAGGLCAVEGRRPAPQQLPARWLAAAPGAGAACRGGHAPAELPCSRHAGQSGEDACQQVGDLHTPDLSSNSPALRLFCTVFVAP